MDSDFAVLLLGANHSLTLVSEPEPGVAARKAAERRWSRDVKLYLLMAFSTVFVPFPELGLDRAYVAGLNLPGSGAWISEPHNVMAAGAFYFGAKALLELRDAVRGTRGGITIDEPPATA
ncbi:MAG: hypothetical protein OEO77_14160 [Acidimicrobiia bacterium]|nr:hypothetical protein [Acidimicrobiia bacterium]